MPTVRTWDFRDPQLNRVRFRYKRNMTQMLLLYGRTFWELTLQMTKQKLNWHYWTLHGQQVGKNICGHTKIRGNTAKLPRVSATLLQVTTSPVLMRTLSEKPRCCDRKNHYCTERGLLCYVEIAGYIIFLNYVCTVSSVIRKLYSFSCFFLLSITFYMEEDTLIFSLYFSSRVKR